MRGARKPSLAKPTQPTTEEDHWRPQTWQDCQRVLEEFEGVCPFVGCRHHLYLDVDERGGVTFNFPDLESWEIPGSCSLEIAGRDPLGQTLEAVGSFRNVTRERVRQIEAEALRRIISNDLALRPLTCNTPKRITRDWGLEDDDDDAAWVVGLPQTTRPR